MKKKTLTVRQEVVSPVKQIYPCAISLISKMAAQRDGLYQKSQGGGVDMCFLVHSLSSAHSM